MERLWGKLTLSIQADRTAIQSRKDAIAKLQKLLTPSTPEAMNGSIRAENFEFLLRYSSKDPKHIKLLGFLLDNRSALGIDMASREEKSGTAMDVAKKFENQPAMDLLVIYQ